MYARKLATGSLLGLVMIIYGYSLALQLIEITTISGKPFWFLAGGIVAAILYLSFPRSLFWLVWIHESTHAFVAWLLGAKLERFEADWRTGGFVNYSFANETWGPEFVALAPYYLQPSSLIACLGISFATPSAHWWLSILAGAGTGYFLLDLLFTLRAPQTDIRKWGIVYSLLIVLALNLLITGTILCTIFPQTSLTGFWVRGPIDTLQLAGPILGR